jgi:hypothetical protein
MNRSKVDLEKGNHMTWKLKSTQQIKRTTDGDLKY